MPVPGALDRRAGRCGGEAAELGIPTVAVFPASTRR